MDVWTFLWLMLALKIPIGALLGIVWWAVHQTPDEPGLPAEGDGGIADRPPSPHRRMRRRGPRWPRRGPHGGRPAAPARVRFGGVPSRTPAPCVARRADGAL